jgi:hypothetical protein
MSRSQTPYVFLSTVFDPAIHEPVRAACPGLIWDPREQVRNHPGRTIEDICRDLIRRSTLFIGVFDQRGGHAPFEEGIEPVTVLEIEVLQALFQRLPIYLFLLPGFEQNYRLKGLVELARRHGLARVGTCPPWSFRRDAGRTELTAAGITMISRVIRDPPTQRLSRGARSFGRHIRRYRNLQVSLLEVPAAAIADAFDADQVTQQLARAAHQPDHAARLSYLWPALRQLSTVPFDDPRYAFYRPAWQALAGAWDLSAAWYGLHDDSPIGKLAAVNSLISILESGGTPADFARGARASGFYSMAKRLWEPFARRSLFRAALAETDKALAAAKGDVSGYRAIRGSIQLKLWHVRQAVRDYEAVVAARAAQNASLSSQGEAWVELGWGYIWAFQFRKAQRALRHGLDLMRQDYRRDPALRADFFIRALMKHALGLALMLRFTEAKESAREGCRLAHQRVAHDQLTGLRGALCRWWGA